MDIFPLTKYKKPLPSAGGGWGRGRDKKMTAKLTKYARRLRKNYTQAEALLVNFHPPLAPPVKGGEFG
jgi:hypothetical protein